MNEPAQTLPAHALEQGFQIGELLIDPQDGQVSGRSGLQKLDPKVMDVLVMLARHAGHVVLREDLLARLWADTIVTDDVLSRCIYELRRQLSLAGSEERLKMLIETIPKRGYRLNGVVLPLPLRPEPRPEPSKDSPRRLRRPMVALGVAIPALALAWFLIERPWIDATVDSPPVAVTTNSIAVLPFADMSAGQDQGYLADGISDEIISRLSRSGNLRVISRWSSFSFRGKPVEIREIAKQLEVNHVLEGSVRKSGDSIRITAQLIAADDNSNMWSETFDRKLGDLFAVQDEIAAAVANALRITLAGTPAASSAPVSHDAYELFLQGEFFYNRRAPGDIERSAKYYHDALAIEPGYARAWAALAGAYSLMAYEGVIEPELGLEKQGEAARKAVELDPTLAVGYARLSQYHWDTGDRKTGYRIWDKALALRQEDPLILNFVAGLAMRAGDIKKALDTQRRLISRDPLAAAYHANLGVYLQAAGRLDEAEAELREAQILNPNLGSGVDLAIARILVLQRRFDDAAEAIEALPPGEVRDHGVALLAHARGRQAEADAALDRLLAQSTKTPDIRLAEVYAFRGMIKEAFRELQSLQDAIGRDEPGMVSQIWSWQVELRVSPFLKPLHADPRWTALLTEPA
jgi:TolB-like protein/DNA-binding winged helix-turn-helix (wHTH) protein/Flp pilus assembly protein TadD